MVKFGRWLRTHLGKFLPLGTAWVGGLFALVGEPKRPHIFHWWFVLITGVLMFLGARLINRAYRKVKPAIKFLQKQKALNNDLNNDVTGAVWAQFALYLAIGTLMIASALTLRVPRFGIWFVGKFHHLSPINLDVWHRSALLALVLVATIINMVWYHPLFQGSLRDYIKSRRSQGSGRKGRRNTASTPSPQAPVRTQ